MRKPRRYVRGVYIPRKRKPYGPRISRSWTDNELMRQQDAARYEFPARWFVHRGPSHIETVEQRMPDGGKRYMAVCPGCQKRRRSMCLCFAQMGRFSYLCRSCLGVRYGTQYAYRARRSTSTEARKSWFARYDQAIEKVAGRQTLEAIQSRRAMGGVSETVEEGMFMPIGKWRLDLDVEEEEDRELYEAITFISWRAQIEYGELVSRWNAA